MEFSEVKIEVYIPGAYLERLRNELTQIGACKVGNYDQVASFSIIQGSWRPLEGSSPFDGEIGKINYGIEYKMELRCSMDLVKEAIRVIKEVHPYEEPLINLIPLVNGMFGLH